LSKIILKHDFKILIFSLTTYKGCSVLHKNNAIKGYVGALENIALNNTV